MKKVYLCTINNETIIVNQNINYIMNNNFNMSDFLCTEIEYKENKFYNKFFHTPKFNNSDIQHYYEKSSSEREIVIRPYSNHTIDIKINQFNFWIEAFSICIGAKKYELTFKDNESYNEFVKEVFRLIELFPNCNSHNEKFFIQKNKKIHNVIKYPKNVIEIRDTMNNTFEFLIFDSLKFTFDLYDISKFLAKHQNVNDSFLYLDLKEKKYKLNYDKK